MKKLSKLLFAFLLASITIASCSKSDYDDSEWQAEQRRRDSLNRIRIDSTLTEQAPLLAQFAKDSLGEGAQLDDSTGIWFKIHDLGEVGSYKYQLQSNGYQLVLPNPSIEVKYQGKLLNGKVFDETLQELPGDEKEDADSSKTSHLGQLIPAWRIAFYPKEIRINGKTHYVGGLTEKGLQKGAIIEFVVPSPYGYDNKEVKDKDGKVTIPANSPLHFKIEVVNIKD